MAKPQKKDWSNIFSSIGTYEEFAGGGTPMAKGQKIDYVADDPKDAAEYRRKHPDALVRVSQPRDRDGQFTYNSANKKELEYGPSRGKTPPPFLVGMRITFAKKSGKGALVDIDGKKYTLPDNIKTKEQFFEMCQQYREKNLDFEGIGANLPDIAKGKGGKTGESVLITKYDFKSGMKSAKQKINTVVNPYTKPKKDDNKGVSGGEGSGNVTPTSGGATSSTPDRSLAQSDPKKFIQDNYDEIQSIADMAKSKGKTLNVDGMVKAFADGDIDSFDEVKKAIEEA